MAEAISVILGSGAFSTLLAGAVVFLARNWIGERIANSIRHEYDQKLETHKAQLAAEHETAIERLRADLQIVAFERQTKFSTLHEKAAIVIAETYAALIEVLDAAKKYLSPLEQASDGSKGDRRENLNQAVIALRKCYRPRAIFLPRALAGQLVGIDSLTVKTANEFAIKVELKGDEADREAWFELWTKLNAEIEPALTLLGDLFRRELGVSE
jgi:hypothetical protein